MVSRLLLTVLALLTASGAVAQDYRISGRVVDAETGDAIETASVAIWRVSARAGVEPFLETGAVTDASGAFQVDGLTRGRYYVVVSFLGYSPLASDTLRLRPSSSVVDLGEMRLQPDAAALGDVEVTAERDRIEIQVDRTVYRIADDPLLSGASTSEALETIPSVEVDVEGNVSLRGVSNVVILIDGRPAPVGRDFVGIYLQSLPAEAVESVEVIPNPSAAFQRDGSGGVLNIVLKENTELGIGGAVTVGGNALGGYQASSVLTYGRGPVRLSATLAARENAFNRATDRFRINRFLGDDATELRQTTDGDRTRSSALASLSADVQVTPKTTLTASANGTLRGGGSDEVTDILELDLSGSPVDDMVRTVANDDDGVSGALRFGLRHDFEGVSEEQQATGGRRRGGGRGGRGRRGGGSRVALGEHGLAVDVRLTASTGEDLDTLVDTGGFDQRVTSDDESRSLTLQADYARPIGQTRLEIGLRSDLDTRTSDRAAETLSASGTYVPDPTQTFIYDLDEEVYAAYVQLAREIGPVAVQAGVRGEATARAFTLGSEAFDYEDAGLFPSLALALGVDDATTLRASYSRRIDRPRGRQLNPFPSTDDPLNVRLGNPDLRPEFTDAVEVSAIRMTSWGTVSVTPFLRYTTDVIRRFQTVDAQGVTTSTFRNLDTATSAGVEAVVAYQPGGPLRGFASLEGFRQSTDGSSVESGLSADAFGWGGRLNANYSLGDRFGWGDLDLQGTLRYRAPQDTEQGRIGSRTFLDLGFRQRLLDGRASLALRARDPFGWGGFEFVQDDPRVFQTFSRASPRQQVSLSFTYTFGRTEERPDRRGLGGGGEAAEPVDF
ncbi:MAG: TonB-dependent receptor [Bacteroidota bacterium]